MLKKILDVQADQTGITITLGEGNGKIHIWQIQRKDVIPGFPRKDNWAVRITPSPEPSWWSWSSRNPTDRVNADNGWLMISNEEYRIAVTDLDETGFPTKHAFCVIVDEYLEGGGTKNLHFSIWSSGQWEVQK